MIRQPKSKKKNLGVIPIREGVKKLGDISPSAKKSTFSEKILGMPWKTIFCIVKSKGSKGISIKKGKKDSTFVPYTGVEGGGGGCQSLGDTSLKKSRFDALPKLTIVEN